MSILVIVVGWATCWAQTDPNLENGFKPYGTYSGSNIDSINLENGNLMLHIPMPFAYPQRGKLQPSYFLGISSKQWLVTDPCAPTACYTWNPPFQRTVPPVPVLQGLGFDNSLDMVVMRQVHKVTDTVNPGDAAGMSFSEVTSVVTADGATHKVTPVQWAPPQPDGTPSYASTDVAIDVSGYTVRESGPDANYIPTGVAVQDRAGNVSAVTGYGNLSCKVSSKSDNETPPGTIVTSDCTQAAHITGWIDPNGNQINLTGQDTLGRAMTMQGFSGTQTTTDYTGCVNPTSQPISSATISNYTGFNGVTNQVKVCYSNISLSTNFGISGIAEYSSSQPVSMIVSVIFLADNSTWSFQYDGYGNITYVGLPLGGSIQYQWESVSLPAPPPLLGSHATPASRAVSQRTVTDNNGNTYVTSYQYGSATYPGSLTTVMTDSLGNDTVSTFNVLTSDQTLAEGPNDVGAYYVTTTKRYQGTQSSGALLKQEDFQYYNNGQTGDNRIFNAFVTQITTTINGKVSQVTRTPDSGAYGINLPNFGLVTAEKHYDLGSGGPGPLLRETDTSYLWQSNNNYLAANLIGLPASVQVKDGSGHVCAETDNGFDDPNRLFSFSGTIPNHGPAPNTVRGNLTSTSRRLTTSACAISSSTPVITSYINWYDMGQVYQQIDPLGNTTTHTYDPAYAGAYSTKTCNAASQCVSGTYDFATGLLTSFTNANASTQASGTTQGDSAHTTVYGYDSLSRITQATFPPDPDNSNAQAVTQFAYPMPLTLPFAVTRTKSVASGVSQDSATTTYDGLGRAFKAVHTSAGNATVVTQYDGLDHVISVTNPYFTTSDPTYGVIQTQYDALGRVTQITAQDGGLSKTDYSNFPTVTATDPAGKVRRSRTDAMGRLVEVDEPGPGANGAGTPGSGSINISGSLQSSSGAGVQATGTVTVSGAVQSMYVWVCNDTCIRRRQTDPGGSVSITVNGHTNSVTYGGGSTANSIANALITSINGDGGAYAWASGPSCADSTDCTVSLQARTPGPNYSLSTQGLSNDEADGFSSFDATYASGSSLVGGAYPSTTYDSGTVTVTVNGFQASASYNQNLNNTASALAQALTNALNASGSPVTASNSGTTITMTAKGVGTATDFVVTGSSTVSFTASSTTLSGGTDPGGFSAAYVTNYSYDVFGNLLQVNQLGDGSQAARVRTFTYDTLSRLLTSQNPEAGTISYSYDADGNMLQKTSPQPNAVAGSTATQTISYCYDNLNRVTGKAYSAQSCTNGQLPAVSAVVSYTYDAGGAAANAIGRLTSLTDQAGLDSYAYNVLGRLKSEQRTITGTPNVTEAVGYSYHLNGSLKALTYPSGSVITYTPDSAGRDVSAIDNGSAINYATGATFGPDSSLNGFVSGASLGTGFAGVTNTFSYNKRLQPVNISAASPSQTVFSLTYDFHLGAGDNGDVFAITNNKDSNRTQTFTYDQLNRLSSAQNAGTNCNVTSVNGLTEYWGNTYGYDAWGNLLTKTVTKCSSENLSVSVAANNQLQGGYTYDIAGNMLHDATANLNYTYDQENRITTAAGITYTYDAGGNRVKKSNGSTGTIYWYSPAGVIAESDLSGTMQHEYVFFGGRRVARKDLAGNAVSYYFHDHLQRASVITDSAGNIKTESDYYPWGGELTQELGGSALPVQNPGFEAGSASGWNLGYWGASSAITSTQAHGGTYSLVQTGSVTGGSYQDVGGLTPGLAYRISVWVRADAGTTAQMYLWVHDTTGANAQNTGAITPGTSWQQVLLTYIADSTGQIRIHLHYIAGAGAIYYDDVQLTPLTVASNFDNHYKFTGKERDTETNLDYFGGRYYSNGFGRFVTPDWSAGPATVPYAHLDNPQTLNLYSYVDNNPTSGIDVDGHSPQEYMVAPGGGWDLTTMMSDGTGETTDFGQDGAASDMVNAEFSTYNQAPDPSTTGADPHNHPAANPDGDGEVSHDSNDEILGGEMPMIMAAPQQGNGSANEKPDDKNKKDGWLDQPGGALARGEVDTAVGALALLGTKHPGATALIVVVEDKLVGPQVEKEVDRRGYTNRDVLQADVKISNVVGNIVCPGCQAMAEGAAKAIIFTLQNPWLFH